MGRINMTDIHKDCENLVFKVTSDKNIIGISSFDESVDSMRENSSPECKCFTNFTIDVYALNGLGGHLTDIGFLKGTSIEAEITFTDGYTFLQVCDMYSTDLYYMAEDICDKDGYVRKSICPPSYNIMYIENMYIEEQYRSLGIGRYLIDNVGGLFSHALNHSHYAYILKPYPQTKTGTVHSLRDSENPTQEEKERLVKFYERAGYKFIDSSDYMLKTTPDALDEIFSSLGLRED